MKLIMVTYKNGEFITNMKADECAKCIKEAERYARSINGDWTDAVKMLQRRWIFQEAEKVVVL